jgi:hypothetical protein
MKLSSALLRFPLLLLAAITARASAHGPTDISTRECSITVEETPETVTWTLRNDRLQRIVRYERHSAILRTISLRDIRSDLEYIEPSAGTSEGSLGAFWNDASSSKIRIPIGSSALLTGHRVLSRENGRKELLLELQGTEAARGLSFTISYLLYPGKRPWIGKRIAVKNNTAKPFIIADWQAEGLT